MKNELFFSLLIIVGFSCGTGNEGGNKAEKKDTTNIPGTVNTAELNGCYLLNIGKDTAKLRLEVNGKSVRGDLSYHRYEKDSNNGTIEGIIHDDIIKVWYRFSSEGTISVRQVGFKVIAGKLAEGYGEMEMRNDTAYFKFPTALRYEEHHPYIKINCN